MNNCIWIPIEFKGHYLDFNVCGLKLQFLDVEINEELRKHCIKFCKWLRKRYWFPVRCNINFEYYSYYKDDENDKIGSYSIFYYAKYDKNGKMYVYPNIDLAVSNYEKEIKKYSKIEVIYHYLNLLAHELTHYFQWYFRETRERNKKSLEIEANKWGNYLANKYIDEVMQQTDAE